jgi:hypothetical protein
MPEFDSVMLSCMHMFASDEKDPRLIKTQVITGKPLVLLPSQGILFSETNSTLSFGNTPQDALTVLGSPQHISYKKSNPLSIHERLHVRDRSEVRDFQYDYFYNYFDIGLDILFDASAHCIKKFIVHTNFPTHPNFNLYQKCNFTIMPPAPIKEKQDGDFDDFEDDFDEVKVITPEMKVGTPNLGLTLLVARNKRLLWKSTHRTLFHASDKRQPIRRESLLRPQRHNLRSNGE